MNLRTISRRVLPVLALATLAAAPLRATSYVMVSDESLADTSRLAVVGQVVAVDRSRMLDGPQGSMLATEYEVAVEETLVGKAPAGTLKVHVPGGVKADGVGLHLDGVPRFRDGERVLLFLEEDGRGGYRPRHLLLGAFHEVTAGGRRFAVRNLRGVAVHQNQQQKAQGAAELRDFDAFARWVKARAAGQRPPADYRVADPDGALGQSVDKYALFADPDDGLHLRWFEFDSGGNIPWRAYTTGQQGLTGGGYAEFQTALQAWNSEAQTPIDYRYAGTTDHSNGLSNNANDGINSVVFNDPRDILPAFDCTTGGVLALGGPWYTGDTAAFQGQSYHPIVEADVVINNGISCFFATSPNASKAAQELFGHELGHTLGLDHSCGDAGSSDPNCTNPTLSDALMRAYVHDDSRGARLNGDDQAGVRALYKQGSTGPAAPTSLTAAATSTTAVHLTWQDKATNETDYRIEYKVLGGTYAEYGSVAANATSADVTGLTPATGYSFRVRAHNAAGFSAYSNEAVASTKAPVAPCVPGAQTLCLSGGRFKVQIAWKTADGATGVGTVVPVTSDDSGLFWFFTPTNWEMLIKVLNACSSSTPRFWVFFAATTNVQYTVTVIDAQTGDVKTYFNPLNTPAVAVTDTDAFATCP